MAIGTASALRTLVLSRGLPHGLGHIHSHHVAWAGLFADDGQQLTTGSPVVDHWLTVSQKRALEAKKDNDVLVGQWFTKG